MTNIKPWLNAIRLRTLPLAFSCIFTGSALAWNYDRFSWLIFFLCLSTAFLLQILSNLANDFGDFSKGTDNENRIGPVRALQSGLITKRQMTTAIVITTLLCLISGMALIIKGTKGVNSAAFIILTILGILATAAAIMYTVGKRPYGYCGLGDLSVFLFFGLTGVAGTFYLHTHILNWYIFLPASAIGFLSTGVLNLNNMRDIESDKESEKKTIPVKIGLPFAKVYQFLLLTATIACASIFILISSECICWFNFLFLLPLIFLLKKTTDIFHNNDLKSYDVYLKIQALSTLAFSILFGIGINI